MFAELFFFFLCQIAIYGKNFCVSAKNAFLLLMRNIIRFVLMSVVSVHAACVLSDLSYVNVLERVGSVLLFVPSRVVVLDKVTDLLLFFGKLLVVGGVGETDARKMYENVCKRIDG